MERAPGKGRDPRIAEGKELKMLYDLHNKRGTLNVDKKEPGRTIARPAYDLKPVCVGTDTVEELTVYCREGVFHG